MRQLTVCLALLPWAFTVYGAAQGNGSHHSQNITTNNGVTVQVNIEKSLKKSARSIDERGWMRLLTPGHDKSPDACQSAFIPGKPKPLVVVMGSVASVCADETCNIITGMRKGEKTQLLVVHKVKTGLLIDARIFDQDGNIIASIVGDKPHINRNYVSDWNRSDEHTLSVIDNHDKQVLHIRLMNETTLSIEGIFNLPKDLQGPSAPHTSLVIDGTKARFSDSGFVTGACFDPNHLAESIFGFEDSN